MAFEAADVMEKVKKFILSEFLPDEDPEALDAGTPLISSAILDSIATIKLVTFLEEQYDVHFEPHEMSIDYLDTLSEIAATVQQKLAAKG